MKKNTKKKLFQQGDVLFFTDKLPDGLTPVAPRSGRFIFAEGEATGHHHSVGVEDGVELYTDEAGTLWCRVAADEATVKHQTHGPITLKKGDYKIGIVREVDPFDEAIGKVRD